MKWDLSVYTAPYAEPMSLTEAKLHLRVDSTADDTHIPGLISAAREYWEGVQCRALVLQTLELIMDAWPDGDEIRLPQAPLRAVSSISYVDIDDTTTTFAASNYNVNLKASLGRITLGYGKSWPSASLRKGGAITIRFVAGYATPFTADASTEILTAAGHTYANGDIVRLTNTGGYLPTGLSTLTNYYVVGVSGNTLQLSATSGGSAINITAAGTGTHFLGEVPPVALNGMKLLMSHWYHNREAVVIGQTANNVPHTLGNLIGLKRLYYAGPARC